MAGRKIHSLLLVGVAKDHGDHRGAATMRATGNLIHWRDDENDARNWFVEFRCDVCRELVLEWRADMNALACQALKDAGIIEP